MGTDAFLDRPLLGLLSNLPVLLGAILMLAPAHAGLRAELIRRPWPWVTVLFLGTRIAFYLVVVGMLGHVSSDLSGFFLEQAEAARAGLVPYRDFDSSYGPFFPYLLGLASLAGGVTGIFALFLAADAGVLVLLGTGGARDRATRAVAAWLHAAAPVVWFFLVRYGQDEIVSALFLTAAFVLHRRGREPLAAAALGVGFLATKFTFGLFVIPFLLKSRSRVAAALAFGGVILAGTLPLLAAGAPVWQPLVAEGGALGTGPSLWRLPVVFTPLTLGWPASAVLAAALIAAWWFGRRAPLAALLVATGCIFLIASPKAYPMYATVFWPFAAVWLAGSGAPGASPGAGSRDGAGAGSTPRIADLLLAAAANLLLGVWWYLDAGGIQGGFGVAVRMLAVLWTLAIPLVLAILGWRAIASPIVPTGERKPAS